MTIAVATPRDDYLTAGVGPYTGHFQIDDASEVEVIQAGVTLALNVDYTVAGTGAANFTVTLKVAPANNTALALLRAQPLGQATDYAPGEGFPAQRVEGDYDKIAKMAQMLTERISRSFRFFKKSLLKDIYVDDPTDQKFLYYDAASGSFKWGVLSALSTLPDPVTIARGGTSSATAAAARAALAVAGLTDENIFTARQHWQKGADIASAAALIPGTDGNYFSVTGAVAITSIAAKAAGSRLLLRFASTPTLTYNAASLILPGGVSIVAAADDVAEFVSEGAGNWRCIDYQKNSGLPVVAPAVVAPATEGARGIKSANLDPVQGGLVIGTNVFTAVVTAFYNLFNGTTGDGFVVSDTAQFNAVNIFISANAAPGTVVYEYWNGAWVGLAGVVAPAWNTIGWTQLTYTMPGDWIVGGTGTNMPAGSFNIRVRQTVGVVTVTGRGYSANKVQLTADEVIATDAGGAKYRTTAFNKTADIRLAGSIINGRDQAGAFGASSFVAYWAITNGAGTWNSLWSASLTAPTLPGGYVAKVLLAVYRVDAAVNLLQMSSSGNKHRYYPSIKDGTAVSFPTVGLSPGNTLTVPTNAISYDLSVSNAGITHLSVINNRPHLCVTPTTTAPNGWPQLGPGAWNDIPIVTTPDGNHVYRSGNAVSTPDLYTMGYRIAGNLN